MQLFISCLAIIGIICIILPLVYTKFKKFGAHEGYWLYIPVFGGIGLVVLAAVIQLFYYLYRLITL